MRIDDLSQLPRLAFRQGGGLFCQPGYDAPPDGEFSPVGGFGAGAILRRDQFVVGVTDAATLWFVTMTRLCFGAGQIVLGVFGSALGIGVVPGLKPMIEEPLTRNHEVRLLPASDAVGPSESDILHLCEEAKFKIVSCCIAADLVARTSEFKFRLLWRALTSTPDIVNRLADLPGVMRLLWEPGAR